MSAPKRVLFISPQPYFAWRGSSIRVKFNVKALASLGYSVDLLTLPIGEEEPDTPANVVRVWNFFGSKTISIGPSLLKLWFDLLLIIRGLSLIFTRKYDVIHGTEEAGAIAWLLGRIRGCKVVYEKHSDAASYKKGFLQNLVLKAYLAVEHFTCRHADLVICTGPGLARQAQEIAPRQLIKDIFDIPSSLVIPDDQSVKTIRDRLVNNSLSIEGDKILVTYVGSFAVYQGVDVIFKAIPEVLQRSPHVIFIIIGGNQEEISACKEALSKHDCDLSRIQFLGLIPPDSLPEYLAASDILMAPRKAGVNTPLKALDYFKAGGAIVATDTPANRFILDETSAKLCEFDPQAFANAIVELSNDHEMRNKLAAKSQHLYESKFNFTVFTNLLQQAYVEGLH